MQNGSLSYQHIITQVRNLGHLVLLVLNLTDVNFVIYKFWLFKGKAQSKNKYFLSRLLPMMVGPHREVEQAPSLCP